MFKILFLGAAAYLVYIQWIRPKPRIDAVTRKPEKDENEFTPYEDITDE